MNCSSRFKILYAFCLMLFGTQVVLACSKTMRWDDDPPYTFIDPHVPGHVQGISVDIARSILNTLGCDLKLVKMPWARGLESLKSGEIDLLSGAFNTPERQEYAYFASTSEHSPNVLFIRKREESIWQFSSLADMVDSKFRLGVQINVSYSQEYELLKQQDEFSKLLYSNSSRKSLWKMLTLNRIDGVIADRKTGLIELQNLNLQGNIIPSSLTISSKPSFYAFSKKTNTREFVGQFDEVFLNLIDEGKVSEIENTYFDE